MQVNETAVLRSRMYLHCHKVWSQHGFQTLKPSCRLQSLKIIIVVVFVVFFIFIIIIINIVIILILAVGQWDFQLPFCIIYSHTCVNCALPLNFLFSSSVCDPDFRGLSPPEQCTAPLFSRNHWVCSCVSLLYINSALSLRFLFYVCSPINYKSHDYPLSKTASGRATFCNFTAQSECGFFPNNSPIFNQFTHF